MLFLLMKFTTKMSNKTTLDWNKSFPLSFVIIFKGNKVDYDTHQLRLRTYFSIIQIQVTVLIMIGFENNLINNLLMLTYYR